MPSRSRAAFVSSSDPFVLLQFFHYFKTVWYDEVDKLYVVINGEMPPGVSNELKDKLFDDKVIVIQTASFVSHGEAIKKFLSFCDEEYVVLLEDDLIIFKKGELDEYFMRLENKDVAMVGSERMSCHPDIAALAKKMFRLDYSGKGDVGCSFWPCFLFINKDDLEYCENYGATHLGDTFVYASFILRNKFSLKDILTVPQYHLSPIDDFLKQEKESIFDGECGYLHIGSLSAGMENTLVDKDDIPLRFFGRSSPKSIFVPPQTEQEKMELERRVIFWRRAHIMNPDAFGSFGKEYFLAIQRLVDRCGLNVDRMYSFESMYEEVISD